MSEKSGSIKALIQDVKMRKKDFDWKRRKINLQVQKIGSKRN